MRPGGSQARMRPTTPGFSRATGPAVLRGRAAQHPLAALHHEAAPAGQRGLVHPALHPVLVLDQPPDLELALDLHRQVAAAVHPFDRIAGARPAAQVHLVGAQAGPARQRQAGDAALRRLAPAWPPAPPAARPARCPPGSPPRRAEAAWRPWPASPAASGHACRQARPPPAAWRVWPWSWPAPASAGPAPPLFGRRRLRLAGAAGGWSGACARAAGVADSAATRTASSDSEHVHARIRANPTRVGSSGKLRGVSIWPPLGQPAGTSPPRPPPPAAAAAPASIAAMRSPASQAISRTPEFHRRLAQLADAGDAARAQRRVAAGLLQPRPVGAQRPAAVVGGEQHHRAPQRRRAGGEHEGVMRPLVRAGDQQNAERVRCHRRGPPCWHGRTGRAAWRAGRRPAQAGSGRSRTVRKRVASASQISSRPARRLADAQDFLQHLGRLQRAHHAGHRAQHAGLAAGRHQAGRRRRRVEAAVARAAGMRPEHRELPLEPQHRGRDQGAPRQHAGIGQQEAGRQNCRCRRRRCRSRPTSASAFAAVSRSRVRLDVARRVDRRAPPPPPTPTLAMPSRSVVWAIWRCRLDSSTTSPSTTPMRPTPAAAR